MSKNLLEPGETQALPKIKLSQATCEKFGYTVGTHRGHPVQIANYRDPDTFEIVAQHTKTADKEFKWVGDYKRAPLFGQWLWRSGGRRVIITEGEKDCMAISQLQDNRWPVVSIKSGAGTAHKDLAESLEWLLQFEQIILSFDMDEPGRAAVQKCVGLFPPGRVYIANLPLKDAHEMVMAGRSEELMNCLWGAKKYRPDGIVTVDDIFDKALEDPEEGLPWCIDRLSEATFGRRYGEVVGLGAGTGIGKTTLITQQIAFDLALGLNVGVFAFEQAPTETLVRVAGQYVGKVFHVPDGSWTKDELRVALEEIRSASNRLYLYDHWGACDWESVRERMRFLRHAHNVRLFYLDHLTAFAAAEDDERKALERIMAELAGTMKELSAWCLFVSHLATPEGSPHEEGGRVKIRHFKGARAIGFWSHFMLAMERDQQSAEDNADQTILRVLKDRYTGRSTGLCIPLAYDPKTGLLGESGHVTFADETEEGDTPF